jgi:hypothetical protein
MHLASLCDMPNQDSFRGLQVWQRSMALVEEIYAVTKSFPRYEQFGLTQQIRKASVSIPSNIGEGKRRKRQPVFLAPDDYRRIQAIVEEVGRMLNGLIASMRSEAAS